MNSFVEIIRARWGTVAHLTFLTFGLATNVIVSSEYYAPDLVSSADRLSHVDSRWICDRHRSHRNEHHRCVFPHPHRRVDLRPHWWDASYPRRRLLAHTCAVLHSDLVFPCGVRDVAVHWIPESNVGVATRVECQSPSEGQRGRIIPYPEEQEWINLWRIEHCRKLWLVQSAQAVGSR